MTATGSGCCKLPFKKKTQRKTKSLEEEENEEMSVSGAAALETGLDAAAVRADLSEADAVMTKNTKEWR